MKIKFKKDTTTAKGEITKGTILNVSTTAGNRWIKEGLAAATK